MKNLFKTLLVAALLAAGSVKAAPTLNSYPTAAATLYLDFDGHDVNSSMWNYGTPFSCLPAQMTDDQILEAFNRVAEDFRPFNINVTTELAKFLAAPLTQRMRIVVTPTSAWYPSVAGIAYVTSFTWGDDTPAFVFSDRLLNDPKRVAEAIAHESGHTMGLSHQAAFSATCTLVSSYNSGVGTGEQSWAPIMGNSVSKNITQWNFGPTPNGCNSLQDNLKVLSTNNGFGYRPDDYADLYTNAAIVGIANNVISKTGLISTTTDRDYFRFDLAENGKLIINATPYSVGAGNSGANLDIKLELQNANGTSIGVYDFKDSMHAKIDTTLPAGTYYLIVDGTSSVNVNNDYGSLGSYTISGSFSGIAVSTTTTTTTTTTTATTTTVSGTKTKGGNKLTISANGKGGGTKSEALVIIYAVEGEEFRDLAKPDPNQTTFIHTINDDKTYIYQLKIVEQTGAVRFSNIVKIDGKENSGFKVIKQAQQPVIVNAAAAYDYQIVDNYGRVIQTGKASAGVKSFDIRNQPAGIYNIKLISDSEQRVEKFMNR